MDGAQALDYARQRYDLPGGDYDRQRHQQQFLKAIAQKATDAGLLTNPIKLDQVIRAVGGALTVDTNGVPLEDTVLALRGLRPDDLVGVKMPSHRGQHRRHLVRGAGPAGRRACSTRSRDGTLDLSCRPAARVTRS